METVLETPTTETVDLVQYIEIDRIAESKTNPRRTVKDAFFADLVQSVKDHGVLQPVLARPLEARSGKAAPYYELVAGHRRLAAAKEAGKDVIPALIRPLDDRQALEIQVIENLQRSDLHPLEEAQGYQQLMQVHKYDVARIAERIGRSAKYVYDRVKLLSLTKDAQRLFLDNKFTAGHAVILARLKPDDQKRALSPGRDEYGSHRDSPLFEEESTRGLFTDQDEDAYLAAVEKDPYYGVKCKSVRELTGWVNRHVRFDHTYEDLPNLFPETHVELSRAKEEAEKVVFITREFVIPDDARDPKQKVLTERSWERADGADDSKTCEHSVLGVVVIGPGRGEAFKVCVAKEKCKTHWGHWQKERAERQRVASRSASTGEDRYAAERARWKEQQEREEEQRKRRAKAIPQILKAVAVKISKAPAGATSELADLVVSALLRYGGPLSQAVPRGKTAEDLLRHLAYNAICQSHNGGYNWDSFAKKARAVGVDAAAILKEAGPPKVQTSAKPEASAKKAAKAPRGKRPRKRGRAK